MRHAVVFALIFAATGAHAGNFFDIFNPAKHIEWSQNLTKATADVLTWGATKEERDRLAAQCKEREAIASFEAAKTYLKGQVKAETEKKHHFETDLANWQELEVRVDATTKQQSALMAVAKAELTARLSSQADMHSVQSALKSSDDALQMLSEATAAQSDQELTKGSQKVVSWNEVMKQIEIQTASASVDAAMFYLSRAIDTASNEALLKFTLSISEMNGQVLALKPLITPNIERNQAGLAAAIKALEELNKAKNEIDYMSKPIPPSTECGGAPAERQECQRRRNMKSLEEPEYGSPEWFRQVGG